MENNSTWTPSQPSPASWKPNAFAPVPSLLFALDTALRDDAGKARRSAVRTEIMARLQVAEAG